MEEKKDLIQAREEEKEVMEEKKENDSAKPDDEVNDRNVKRNDTKKKNSIWCCPRKTLKLQAAETETVWSDRFDDPKALCGAPLPESIGLKLERKKIKKLNGARPPNNPNPHPDNRGILESIFSCFGGD